MEIARHWRLREQRYRLIGECCSHCEKKIFPPRDICPGCGQETKNKFQFSGRGEIYSHTTIYEAPTGYEEQAPFPLALVRLEEGPLMTAQLTDLDPTKPVQIYDKVEMVTRRLKVDGDPDRGQIIYGPKFRPPILRQTPEPAPG